MIVVRLGGGGSCNFPSAVYCGTTNFMTSQIVVPKKKRGPPATGKGTQIQVRLQDDLLSPLDRFTAEETDNPSRSEAIRRILRDWLASHGHLKA